LSCVLTFFLLPLPPPPQVHLTEAACALSAIYGKSVHSNTNACHTAEIVLSPYRKELQNTEDTIARNGRLWDGLRERLRGELLGALPPPGAPLGALSIAPNGPVSHMYGYVCAMSCQPGVLCFKRLCFGALIFHITHTCLHLPPPRRNTDPIFFRLIFSQKFYLHVQELLRSQTRSK